MLWALAGVAQWVEHWPANERVTGLIPSQGSKHAPNASTLSVKAQ